MMNKWKSSALVLGVVLAAGAPAFALNTTVPTTPAPEHRGWGGGGGGGTPPPNGAAPEVDPSLAVGGISFLAGSLVVLRSRLRK